MFKLPRMPQAGASAPKLLVLVAAAAHLVPVWAFRYFPSQDGPAHVANASILLHYSDAARPVFREFLTVNHRLSANWPDHLILAAGMAFTAPPTAEKILLTIYAIAYSLSVWYALSCFGNQPQVLFFMAQPFAFGYTLHMGFYNFSLSLILFFLIAGYWWRHCDVLHWRQVFILALLFTTAEILHVLSFLAAGLLLFLLTLQRREGARDRLAALLVASAPGLYLAAGVCANEPSGSQTIASDRIIGLLYLRPLVCFARAELWPAMLLAALFGLLGLHILRRRITTRKLLRADALAPAAGVFVLLYLLVPNDIGTGTGIPERLALYFFFIVLFWLAGNPWPPILRRTAEAAGAIIFAGFLCLHTLKYAELNSHLEELMALGSHIEANHTVLALFPLKVDPLPALGLRIDAFRHSSGYIGAERQALALNNYEAHRNYFPAEYRSGKDPYEQIGPLDRYGAGLEFLTYSHRTGGRVDYILARNLHLQPQRDANVLFIERQLAAGFEPVAVSARQEWVAYRVRPK